MPNEPCGDSVCVDRAELERLRTQHRQMAEYIEQHMASEHVACSPPEWHNPKDLRRIGELEGQLNRVISEAMRRTAFGTTTPCPPIRNRFHACPCGSRPVVAECHKCWDKWSKEDEQK